MEKFDEIYSCYLKDVYRFLVNLSGSPDIAEEVTQQTFAIAFEKLDTFRGECKLSVWLCQIAKHEFFAWEKRNRKQKPFECENGAATGGGTLEHMIDKEDAGQIMRILHGLPEPYKEVFMLRVMGEVSFRDIGQLFHKSESWGRVTYYRAKKMICERIGGE